MTDESRPPRRAPALAWAVVALFAVLASACGRSGPMPWAGYAEGEVVYLAAPVAGTLQALSVQRGQSVALGAPVFRLDDVAAQAALAEARARESAATAQADNTTKGRRADEIAVTRAQLVQAQALARQADAELARQTQLVADRFVSASHLDTARAAAVQARSRVSELQAALRVAELPARADEQKAARANADAATQAQAQLRWRQEQAVQRAPADGVVVDTLYRVGEYVPAGQPVVALLPPAHRKARFYVPEAELGSLALAQAVELRCDGCGAPIAARVSFISPQPEYTPPVIYSNSQRARLSFMVEAVPLNAADAVRLHPGQPLDVHRVVAPS